MIRNYLKIALRSLWRTKVHTAINIGGLSLSIGCCMLIALFVADELTFDAFHTNSKRIYRAYVIEDYGENERFFNTVTPFILAPTLKDNFAEVASVARIHAIGSQVKVGNDMYRNAVFFTNPEFFSIFDFTTLQGDPALALTSPNQVVLTRQMAERYFGKGDVINKPIALELGEKFEEFIVKAVIENFPSNSSIKFNVLISDLNYPKLYTDESTSSWFEITPETYVLLQPGTTPETLTAKFPALFRKILGPDFKGKYEVGLQPLLDIHLNPDFPLGIVSVSNPRYAYILGAIALLILSVACINFVTLSIGRSLRRAPEVAIRKVVGAQRRQLVFQFIGEAMIVTLVSLVVGTGLAILSLPLFNTLSGKELVFQWNGFLFATAFALAAIIGLFAGSYPAFVLSSFKPVAILRGSIRSVGARHGLRKVLVGLQLVLSIFLITSTIIMQQQLHFLQTKNLGFSKEELVTVRLNVPRTGRMVERVNNGFEKVAVFKTALSNLSGIAAICGSSHDFGAGKWVNVGYTDDKGVYRTFNLNTIDYDYIPTLKMEFVAGRNFSDKYPADAHRSLIVNEAFVKEYGWTDGIGQRIPGKNFQDHEIVGVVKDFNYSSLYTKVEPLVMAMDPTIPLRGGENWNVDESPVPKLIIRLRAGQHAETIAAIKKVWDELTGGEEFELNFVDETLNAQYRSDQNLGTIVRIATALAILIASLGLYALASLAMQQRTREISIRKVMGATVKSLLVLLSREYMVMLVVALVISIPITWYFMSRWLQTFEYRISVGWQAFVLAGAVSVVVALLTVSYQALRTAWTKPVDSLKE